jgi:hypothetical protein
MPAWDLTKRPPGLDRDPLGILLRVARDLTGTPSGDRVWDPPGTSLGPTRDYGGTPPETLLGPAWDLTWTLQDLTES